jgi:antitoxin PrlF
MAVKNKREDVSCCISGTCTCCKVESLVSVDERGQMVLPKDVRDKVGLKAGDKLAVVSCEKDGEVCCITLIKVEGLSEMVRDRLGPVLKEIF